MTRTSCLKILGRAAAGVAVLGALSAYGCQPSPAVTVVHLRPGERTETDQGDVLKTRRGAQETFVGLRGGFHAVRSVEDWRALWPSGGEAPFPATLDPARSMLLVAAADDSESVAIKVTKVLETGDRVLVWVKETRAGESCVARAERPPVDAVVAPRVDKPVKFYVEDERAESCGAPPAVTVSCRTTDAPRWAPAVTAQPGDTVECEMSAESRGKFALIDSVLSLGQLPGGSGAKLTYTKGPLRGAFAIDVFGTYAIRAEASDESGRRSTAGATVDVLPPKTRDVLVQLVWTNFDASDDPETFPRVKLRAIEEAKGRYGVATECSLDKPRPELCEVKTRSAYTHMRLKASSKRLQLDVKYVDERVERGPVACVQIYFDGARTGETCDRQHRDADERWQVGPLEMETGKLPDGAGTASTDAGAPDAGSPALTKPLPPAVPAPKPGPPPLTPRR